MPKQPRSLKEIEASIRAAGTYVVASDFLRPRVLEAARQKIRQDRRWLRIFQLAAVLLLAIGIGIPASQRIEAWRQKTAAPTNSEVQRRAMELARQRHIGPTWATVEVFQEIQSANALKLPTSR